MSKVVSIASQKGGVGKTTTAINLAGAISSRGKKVLIIDMDPQCGTVFGMGLRKDAIHSGVFNIIKDADRAEDVIHLTQFPSIDIIPFGMFDTISTESAYTMNQDEEEHLVEQIKSISSKYDFTFIDCPPGSGPFTKAALEASHSLIIPLQSEPLSLKTLPQLLKLIKTTKSINPDLNLEGILLTQYERSSPISKEVLQQVVNHFPKKTVIEIIIPYDESFSISYKTGKPLTLSDTPIAGASAYKLLADELIRGSISKN